MVHHLYYYEMRFVTSASVHLCFVYMGVPGSFPCVNNQVPVHGKCGCRGHFLPFSCYNVKEFHTNDHYLCKARVATSIIYLETVQNILYVVQSSILWRTV